MFCASSAGWILPRKCHKMCQIRHQKIIKSLRAQTNIKFTIEMWRVTENTERHTLTHLECFQTTSLFARAKAHKWKLIFSYRFPSLIDSMFNLFPGEHFFPPTCSAIRFQFGMSCDLCYDYGSPAFFLSLFISSRVKNVAFALKTHSISSRFLSRSSLLFPFTPT